MFQFYFREKVNILKESRRRKRLNFSGVPPQLFNSVSETEFADESLKPNKLHHDLRQTKHDSPLKRLKLDQANYTTLDLELLSCLPNSLELQRPVDKSTSGDVFGKQLHLSSRKISSEKKEILFGTSNCKANPAIENANIKAHPVRKPSDHLYSCINKSFSPARLNESLLRFDSSCQIDVLNTLLATKLTWAPRKAPQQKLAGKRPLKSPRNLNL